MIRSGCAIASGPKASRKFAMFNFFNNSISGGTVRYVHLMHGGNEAEIFIIAILEGKYTFCNFGEEMFFAF